MKIQYDRTQNLHVQSVAADLAARVGVIFEQYPLLCGFSVQKYSTLTKDRAVVQLQHGLCLADVAVTTPPGFRVTQKFCNQIASMLLELMNEEPEVLDLLSGCTFARTVH